MRKILQLRRSWNPGKLPGLRLCLEADAGINAPSGVSSWNDVYTGISASQSNIVSRPSFSSSGGPNNKPYLDFSSGSSFLDLGSLLDINNAAQEWYIIYKTSQVSTYRLIQKRGTGTIGTAAGWQISFAAGNNANNNVLDDGAGNAISSTGIVTQANDNSWHVLNYRWDNGNGLSIYFDNVLKSSSSTTVGLGAAGKNLTTARNCTIGCAWDAAGTQSQFFTGRMTVMMQVSGTVGGSDRSSLHSYITQKYGISL